MKSLKSDLFKSFETSKIEKPLLNTIFGGEKVTLTHHSANNTSDFISPTTGREYASSNAVDTHPEASWD